MPDMSKTTTGSIERAVVIDIYLTIDMLGDKITSDLKGEYL